MPGPRKRLERPTRPAPKVAWPPGLALSAAVALACASALVPVQAQPLPPEPAGALPAQGPSLPVAPLAYRVEVVGVALLPGLGVPLRELPLAAQSLQGDDLDSRRASNLATLLAQQISSANVNDTTGNPFQFDLQFRGFTASPALGTPQGLSVFLDGVRVNESFGDTVNWDLIPDLALAEVTVLPGTHPLYGLNTLGGAVVLRTRRGFDEPDTLVRAQGGSFGRAALEFQLGGHEAGWDHYLAARRWHEDGWAAQSRSDVRQLFAQRGWRDGVWDVSASLALANNSLQGSQTLPLSFSDTPRDAYSYPDGQTNRMALVSLHASRKLEAGALLEGSLYWRQVRSHAVNSNVNDEFDTAAPVGPGNQPTGNAFNSVSQGRPGATLQWSRPITLGGVAHQWLAGATLDAGHTVFTQADQEAGSSRDTRSNEPITTTTALHASNQALGLFAADRFHLTQAATLSLALRQDRARVALHDQMGTALNGHHRFSHLSPSVGLAWSPQPAWTMYGNYSEGLRVPTPVELTCADPEAPCALPNAFVADPPLKAVRAQTLEWGVRARNAQGLGGSASVFRSELLDDIQFISAGGGASNAGYFQNVGRTSRQGLELAADQRGSRWRWNARYSLLWARFETPMVLNSPNHSQENAGPPQVFLTPSGGLTRTRQVWGRADSAPISCATCTEIAVRPGDRLPGLPRQMLKLRLETDPLPDWTLGAALSAQSKLYARGDESNTDRHGPVPGFALLNLDAEWRLAPGWSLGARVDNLFDRRYSGFATLGQNVFTGPGRSFDATGATWRSEPFRAQGAPRTVGVSLSWQPGER
jgi:iron complex outermembrane receptor protein